MSLTVGVNYKDGTIECFNSRRKTEEINKNPKTCKDSEVKPTKTVKILHLKLANRTTYRNRTNSRDTVYRSRYNKTILVYR